MTRTTLLALLTSLLALAVFAGTFFLFAAPWSATDETGAQNLPEAVLGPAPGKATSEEVHRLCGACHVYPPADIFPRAEWRKELKRAYDFLRDSRLGEDFPSLESVALYYESRAPSQLRLILPEAAQTPLPLEFQPTGHPLPQGLHDTVIANVNLVHLFDERKLDILACDMRNNRMLVLRPYESPPQWRVLGPVRAPAHAEVVDLDGDGIKDVVVAGLGSFAPSNDKVAASSGFGVRPTAPSRPTPSWMESAGSPTCRSPTSTATASSISS